MRTRKGLAGKTRTDTITDRVELIVEGVACHCDGK